MKFYLYCIVFVSILSCSTIQRENGTDQSKLQFKSYNKDFKTLIIKADISATAKGMSNSASIKLMEAATDSLSLSLYGPFSISLGKLFATSEKIIFINNLTSQVLTGTPNEQNMRTAVMLPLAYIDFAHLIRCETPADPHNFKFEKQLNENESLFKSDVRSDIIDYAVIEKSSNNITQYQRKLIDGTLILHVFFQDYQLINGINYSMKQLYKFPEIDALISMEIKEVEINSIFTQPLSFNIPAGMDVINLNEK